MLASTADESFDDNEWLFELKLDGYRAIAEISTNRVKLYSRNGLSFATHYPVITEALQKIKQEIIVDGEIVLINEEGKPDFQKLQHYESNMQYPLVYYVFDILQYEGEHTYHFPLLERKNY